MTRVSPRAEGAHGADQFDEIRDHVEHVSLARPPIEAIGDDDGIPGARVALRDGLKGGNDLRRGRPPGPRSGAASRRAAPGRSVDHNLESVALPSPVPAAPPSARAAAQASCARPNTSLAGKRSNRPSSTITLPPPPPSSAGLEDQVGRAVEFRVSARERAVPSSMVVWPSCPQACMRPACVDLCGMLPVSCIGRQSISARRPIARLLAVFLLFDDAHEAGFRHAPVDLYAEEASWSATSWRCGFPRNASSGCAWMSRRMVRSSEW